MSHARQQIRDKVVSLVTGLTTTGANVFASRVYPLQDGELPGLCVFTRAEEVDEEQGKVERLQHRGVFISVVGYDKLIAGLDDNLDTIAAEVETAVFADRFMSGLIVSLDLVSTDIEIDTESEKPVGEITLTFLAQYLTQEAAPETAI